MLASWGGCFRTFSAKFLGLDVKHQFSQTEDVQSMTVEYIPHPYLTVTYPHPSVFDSTANTVASVARLLGEIFGRQGLFWLHMIVSTENTLPPKSTKSRNSDSSVFRGTNSNWDFGLVWYCTKKFEFLDLVYFECVAFSVESVIMVLTYKHPCSARSVRERLFWLHNRQTYDLGLCSGSPHLARSTNKKGLWLLGSNGGDGTVMDFSFRSICRGAHTCTLREEARRRSLCINMFIIGVISRGGHVKSRIICRMTGGGVGAWVWWRILCSKLSLLSNILRLAW